MSLLKIPRPWPPEPVIVPLNIVTRESWTTVPPAGKEERIKTPVMNVMCLYTRTEPAHTKLEAVKILREMQQVDMKKKHTDIRYSFLITSDGTVYEGRGWTVMPHLQPYYVENKKPFISIGLMWNRDYERGYCRSIMVQTQEQLIRNGVANNYIHPDFEQFLLYY